MNARAELPSAYRAQSHRPRSSAWRGPISINDTDALRPLLAQCALGNRQAFETLYRSVSPRLHGVALRFMGRADLAEEVLQEAFVRIWYNASRYEAHLAAPMTWMVNITRNLALDDALTLVAELTKTARTHRIDLLHANTLSMADLAGLSPVRSIGHIREIGRISGARMKRLLGNERLLAVSDATAQNLIDQGAPPHKLQTCYNGIDLRYWDPERWRAEGRALRAALEDRQLLLSIGQLGPRKGQDLLLSAFGSSGRRPSSGSSVRAGRPSRSRSTTRQRCTSGPPLSISRFVSWAIARTSRPCWQRPTCWSIPRVRSRWAG